MKKLYFESSAYLDLLLSKRETHIKAIDCIIKNSTYFEICKSEWVDVEILKTAFEVEYAFYLFNE